jgi:hypothetical protein
MSRILRTAYSESLGLVLELLPHVAVFRPRDEPEITAILRNDGNRILRLVMPGDGSFEGWRTPLIEWEFTPDTAAIGRSLKSRTCGNITGIRQDAVFALVPGESRDLGKWIVPSLLPGSAECRASIIYSNDPTITIPTWQPVHPTDWWWWHNVREPNRRCTSRRSGWVDLITAASGAAGERQQVRPRSPNRRLLDSVGLAREKEYPRSQGAWRWFDQ